jgi:predicted DNA-binding transcriptional regulator YafY
MPPRLRHDALIRSLRRSGSSTVGALAGEVGVSRRTVLRDLGTLREEGYLLETDPGRGGGVRLQPQAMRATALTVTEVFALILSIAALRVAGTLPFTRLADAGLSKIERRLPPDQLRDLRRLLACLHVGKLSPLQNLSDAGPIDPGLLPAFEQGFLRLRHLRFTYRDAQGTVTRREVEPQALLILPPLWYLVAWDRARGAFRHFRMDRITAPEVDDAQPFRRRHVPFEADVCPFATLPR